jgi:protoheme IX farnesyltransferase
VNPLEQSDGGLPAGASVSELVRPLGLRAVSGLADRLADLLVLTKPRISVLVLLVTAAAFCLASDQPIPIALLWHTLLGTALVAGSANALNQYMERDFDRLMQRTSRRPIPAGRLAPVSALLFGAVVGLLGLIYLVVLVNSPTAAVAATTLFAYLLAYTPLKRRTVLNTWVGAVPGALPPVIGFAAAGQAAHPMAWILFAVLYLWQLPHFFAIAWMYREDYADGGFKMLAVADPTGARTARHSVGWSIALMAASLAPVMLGLAGSGYAVGAIVLGALLVFVALRLAACRQRERARSLLLASVLYLPALLGLLLLERAWA